MKLPNKLIALQWWPSLRWSPSRSRIPRQNGFSTLVTRFDLLVGQRCCFNLLLFLWSPFKVYNNIVPSIQIWSYSYDIDSRLSTLEFYKSLKVDESKFGFSDHRQLSKPYLDYKSCDYMSFLIVIETYTFWDLKKTYRFLKFFHCKKLYFIYQSRFIDHATISLLSLLLKVIYCEI